MKQRRPDPISSVPRAPSPEGRCYRHSARDSNPCRQALPQRCRSYGPLRHPITPFLTVTGLRLVITSDHVIGLPVLRASPLCACCRHYPGTATGGVSSLLPPSRISLARKGDRVGLCNDLFEDCSAFTRVTACTLVESPKVIRYIEGFSYFITSITAPIATGWSEIVGWDSHPLRNAALSRKKLNIYMEL